VVIEGDLGERRLDEYRGVDALALDAAIERQDRPPRGQGAELVAVGVDEVRRIAGGGGRQELLEIELALRDLGLDPISEGLLREVHARGGDLVHAAEAHHAELARELRVGIVLRLGVIRAASADRAPREHQRPACEHRRRLDPEPSHRSAPRPSSPSPRGGR